MAIASPRRAVLAGALLALMAAGTASGRIARAASPLPPVTMTSVAADNSSAKIDFLPVTGAKDYRVFDVSNPSVVKYAGTVHLDAGMMYHFVTQADGITPVYPYTSTLDRNGVTQPRDITVPGAEIEWNMLDDGRSHTLEVQAVDQLGPTPPANLSDSLNNPLNPPGGMLGANEGPTPDGKTSINGQGPSSDAPHVIAQSAPFVVRANSSLRAIPSRPDAVQSFFDTFDTSEGASLQQVGPANGLTGAMTYTLGAGTSRAWTIQFQGADTDHSMPMIDAGHFMDVLYEGVTPSAAPKGWAAAMAHTSYTSMAMSPQPTADLSGGKLLHLTDEVDGHLAQTYRWLAWQLAPATDPITNFQGDNYFTGGFRPSANTLPVNHTNHALWLQAYPRVCDAMLYEGSRSPANPAPLTNAFMPLGPGVSATCQRTSPWGGNGIGLDNRERWDVFLTTRHLALFENGQLVAQSDIPGGLPFTQAKLYFTHYVYAMAPAFEQGTLARTAPWETYWLNEFPYSDERHWDNMGFEVLPASAVPADWSTLAALIHLPGATRPAFFAG